MGAISGPLDFFGDVFGLANSGGGCQQDLTKCGLMCNNEKIGLISQIFSGLFHCSLAHPRWTGCYEKKGGVDRWRARSIFNSLAGNSAQADVVVMDMI
jgi:hypothetical protein